MRTQVETEVLSVDETPNIRSRTSYDKPYVRSLFDRIAHRYDLLNHLLSSGIDFYWRAKAIELLSRHHPQRILDVATGTADLAIRAAKIQPQQIIGIDISGEMLKHGRRKISQRHLESLISLQEGDAENLPFADGAFDAVTAAFGVRNFSNLERGVHEMLRVLRKGGVLLVLEFSRPGSFPVKQLYTLYSKRILPVVGGFISNNREAYEYLPKTVSEFPDGEAMLNVLRRTGFSTAEQLRLTLGIVTIYTATK